MKRLLALISIFQALAAFAGDAAFYRAINLNGPALTIDGHNWEGSDAKDFSANGATLEKQALTLRPATDSARARMIRSSRIGDKVDLTLDKVPAGKYQVFLYVWEHNHTERFKVLLNDKVVVEAFDSGSPGMWKRLGPWLCEPVSGKIKVAARASNFGVATLSGLEVWSGDGPAPAPETPKFVNEPTPDQVAFFESKIRPVLVENCYACHSAEAKKIKGALMLDSRAGIQKGGDSGPAIAPGDPDASLLIQAVRRESDDIAMPPKSKLPPEHVAALVAWVKMGAPDPRTTDTVAAVQSRYAIDWKTAKNWWSFQSLSVTPPPTFKEWAWPESEIDRFILEKIKSASLTPAPDASKRVLIRRATFDLIGLPPTPEDVAAFVADDSPSAFEKVVDRLLSSPQYGERWGRHWLDVVRYADTAGDNSDFPIPQIHRYRNWVIDAFNRDLPYDQFVIEQLAGDLLPDRTQEQLIATGYLANARRFGSRVEDYPQHLTIEDTIDNLGRTFLGLTINCARCHDHKFDPISTQDYYALYGIFNSTRYPWPGIELEQRQRDLVPMTALAELDKAKKALADFEVERARLDKELKKPEDELKKRKDEQKKKLDAALKDKQGDEKKKLEEELKAKHAEENKKLDEDIKTAKAAVKAHAEKKPPYELAYAVAESAKIGDSTVQQKGDPAKPGAVEPRHFLTAFGGTKIPADDKSSGRMSLAKWILGESRPLAARVMVNRIWQHHFGRGLVPTPNDFGKQGKPPTHPELLDRLAMYFVTQGWSIKKVHRLIMLSHTYRLSGERSEEALAKDPTNELLAAFPRQRLDAEAIRDTLLLLGGTLDTTPAGAHPFPPQSEWKFTQHNPFKAVYETNRRSVYLMTQRIQRHPFLAIFDGADPSASTPARTTSTTPLQALFLLNDPLVHEQAKKFAARIVAHAKDDDARITRVYELALSHPASSEEIADAKSFLSTVREKLKSAGTPPEKLEAEAWQAMVRVILRLNEFVYID